jgi:hypothetical protein
LLGRSALDARADRWQRRPRDVEGGEEVLAEDGFEVVSVQPVEASRA